MAPKTKKINRQKETQFKPGNPGGPGRPSLLPELKNIPHLSRDESRKLLAKFSRMAIADVEAFVCRKDVPAIELVVAQIFLKAIEHGDPARLNFVFDRTIGKVSEKLEIEAKPYVIRRPSTGEEVVLGAAKEDDSNDEKG